MIRILIVDDHKIFRVGLRALLEQELDLEVVGEAGNGHEAVQQVKKLRPDLVIMDVAMPVMNGVEASSHILSIFPETRILALSMYSDRRYVLNMFQAGVSGYLLKDCAYEELSRAIRWVMAGKMYLPPDIAKIFIQGYKKGFISSNTAFSLLTPREREVLKLIAEGKSTAEIAASLSISEKTINSHRMNIMTKLEVSSVAELTKFALREGLTSF
ncbi:MAG: response regulator transcription factor [Deltaproteobacteria bacterium]|nr:response regulator transcription factor [Deltaproteobacteria bacterium]